MTEIIVKRASQSFMCCKDVYIPVIIKIGGYYRSRYALDRRHFIRICCYKGLLANIGEGYISFIVAVIPIYCGIGSTRKEVQIAVVVKINREKDTGFV